MKKLFTVIALGMSLALGAAHAADDKAPAAKKSKLATCSAEAKGLKGEEYKKKRDECMKADTAAATTSASAAPSATPSATPAAASSPACEKSAADKKLHGAAQKAHIKKCMAEAK